MRVALSQRSNLTIASSTFDSVEWGGKRLFLTHYPQPVNSMAKSGDYDAVFYGHNHKKHMSYEGDCLILNPGEISAHKTGIAHFALYDSNANSAEIIPVEGDTITVLTDTVKEFRKTITFDVG